MSIETSKTQFFTGDVDMSSFGSSYPIQDSVHTISMHYAITDVANWFLSKESMTHKKLQKLCYYAQAWGLALFNLRITDSRFEAWVHGPVSPGLFQLYKEFYWHPIPRYTGALAESAVLKKDNGTPNNTAKSPGKEGVQLFEGQYGLSTSFNTVSDQLTKDEAIANERTAELIEQLRQNCGDVFRGKVLSSISQQI
ncbi:MAG: Panacea domain-containing protein [Oscillospiraceae bacterium]